MQASMLHCMNVSECQSSSLPYNSGLYDTNAAISSPESPVISPFVYQSWAFKLAAISVISMICLSAQVQARWASKRSSTPAECKTPPQMPYFLPVVGNMLSYLRNPAQLAFPIRCDGSMLQHFVWGRLLTARSDLRAGESLELRRWFASISLPKMSMWSMEQNMSTQCGKTTKG